MKKSKKLFPILLCSTFLLAACSQHSTTNETTNPNTKETTQAPKLSNEEILSKFFQVVSTIKEHDIEIDSTFSRDSYTKPIHTRYSFNNKKDWKIHTKTTSDTGPRGVIETETIGYYKDDFIYTKYLPYNGNWEKTDAQHSNFFHHFEINFLGDPKYFFELFNNINENTKVDNVDNKYHITYSTKVVDEKLFKLIKRASIVYSPETDIEINNFEIKFTVNKDFIPEYATINIDVNSKKFNSHNVLVSKTTYHKINTPLDLSLPEEVHNAPLSTGTSVG